MSLPHHGQTGFGALRLQPRATSVLLRLGPCVRQRYDPLLPARVRPSGRCRVAIAAGVCWRFGNGGRHLGVVGRRSGVTGAAPVRVLDFCPDATVHHTDQIRRLHEDKDVKVMLLTFRSAGNSRVYCKIKLSLIGAPVEIPEL